MDVPFRRARPIIDRDDQGLAGLDCPGRCLALNSRFCEHLHKGGCRVGTSASAQRSMLERLLRNEQDPLHRGNFHSMKGGPQSTGTERQESRWSDLDVVPKRESPLHKNVWTRRDRSDGWHARNACDPTTATCRFKRRNWVRLHNIPMGPADPWSVHLTNPFGFFAHIVHNVTSGNGCTAV